MSDVLKTIIRKNRAGAPVAIPSVCSAHPDVLRASLVLAQQRDRHVVIEATSNQVNQDGGYTGMRPTDFIDLTHKIADAAGVDRERIIFGGDHLGPQAWRAMPAEQAMEKARVLVRDYVKAGFGKIHLDCSEGCAGEPAQLGDDQTAERSADLARVCADAGEDLLFVVGTEVPPPGGARADEDGAIAPTDAEAARKTLAAHMETFGALSPMIGGLVVQPGVEFTPTDVHKLPIDRDPGFLAALSDYPQVCLEAHSTDYQDDAVYPRLAELGFAFQKVGPALTFAYRDAVYALDQVQDSPHLRAVMERLMLADPSYWQGHYHGSDAEKAAQRHDGLADRIRYYWPQPDAQAAIAKLQANVNAMDRNAVLAHFDAEIRDRAEVQQGDLFQRIVDAHVARMLDPYFFGESA
ncbi:class II D-tagatose-bisphosphate aldolase non-catalytic subunit [Thalassorhabdomicrobium marinisediminis]|uniref:Tagatose-6-phosphate kinase n=1 Tax=Thalassorhabdomicrobium marinisediminis TaxID=2170577 RepID=A0A2T7FX62_9RHOB|nr:class II D-tagatose-bisphosphate aldolase, non-catalytic subunit [Thalassorhabdomicrobium marinisediminis]PVA06756.1 tagatose-6-phosphate kinase [Thalassorhabdomicrobium marinisediminis]